MAFFKRDLPAIIAKEDANAAALTEKLAGLRVGREAVLVDGDDAAIERHDGTIAATEKSIATSHDRLDALHRELKRESAADLERRRAEAIAAIQRKFDARVALAIEAEQAITHLGDVVTRLFDSRSIVMEGWPDGLFSRVRQDELRSRLDRELAWALFSAGRPTATSACRIPAPTNELLGVTGVSPLGLSGAIELEHQNLLVRLCREMLPNKSEAAA